VYYSHAFALSAYGAANRFGLRIGRDFGLACCDSSVQVYESFPELTRVEFDRYTAGKRAAAMIIEALETGKPQPSVRLRDEFVPGETLGRVG
jgi:DNA-binding LacI/PurR family transcriptional regulator